MNRYRLLKPCSVHGIMRPAGYIVELRDSNPPSSFFELVSEVEKPKTVPVPPPPKVAPIPVPQQLIGEDAPEEEAMYNVVKGFKIAGTTYQKGRTITLPVDIGNRYVASGNLELISVEV